MRIEDRPRGWNGGPAGTRLDGVMVGHAGNKHTRLVGQNNNQGSIRRLLSNVCLNFAAAILGSAEVGRRAGVLEERRQPFNVPGEDNKRCGRCFI